MTTRFKSDWLLYTVWVIILVLVIFITWTRELESTSFFGITETREIVISSESSVEVKKISVVEGQSVNQQQLIVELISPDLTIKINQVSHQLDELKAQKGVNKNELISKISQLKAEREATQSEINNKIRQLENQYNINKALTSELKSIQKIEMTDSFRASNPILIAIEILNQELSLKVSPINIQLELLQDVLDASESPIEIQVERLVRELELLNHEEDNLTIYAQISGIIGSVNYKSGEIVAPHSPILTLHTKNPSLIKGYIYEDVYTHISVGMEVGVTSLTDSKTKITGTVVGVGSRIVEYPVRLRKHPDLQVWGREIIIKIPAVNPLILGEKVLINATPHKSTLLKGYRADLIFDVLKEYSTTRDECTKLICFQNVCENKICENSRHLGRDDEAICDLSIFNEIASLNSQIRWVFAFSNAAYFGQGNYNQLNLAYKKVA